jgi:hypothetical protein
MPYIVEKRDGPRPYKIIKKDTGEVVGSSVSAKDAIKSIKARYVGEKKG